MSSKYELNRPAEPDYERFVAVLERRDDASYVPLYEMISNYFQELSGLKSPCTLDYIDQLALDGGWCSGSGKSISDYVPLALASRHGIWPKRQARRLVSPILILMIACAIVAIAAGGLGFVLAEKGAIWLLEPLASRVPPARHVSFLTCMWAHTAS